MVGEIAEVFMVKARRTNWPHFAFWIASLLVITLLMVSLPGAVENAHSSITLNWTRPATNTDGTQLTDLAGYKVYYGSSSRSYIAPIVVGNVNTYTFTNLAAGSYYFAVTAYDTSGNESAFSNEVFKTELSNVTIVNPKIGIFRNGTWYLDANGNDTWDASVDAAISFGMAGDIPVVGDWNGSGTTKIGVFRNGMWYLDIVGNGTWTPGVDAAMSFGMAGDIPVVGDWNGAAQLRSVSSETASGTSTPTETIRGMPV